MQVQITVRPSFRFDLTAKEAEMLKILAGSHYDSTCRKSADVGGFIYGWNNMMFNLASDEAESVTGTWDELDLACKILEPSNYIGFEVMMPCGMQLYAQFRKLLQTYNATYYPVWQATVEV